MFYVASGFINFFFYNYLVHVCAWFYLPQHNFCSSKVAASHNISLYWQDYNFWVDDPTVEHKTNRLYTNILISPLFLLKIETLRFYLLNSIVTLRHKLIEKWFIKLYIKHETKNIKYKQDINDSISNLSRVKISILNYC